MWTTPVLRLGEPVTITRTVSGLTTEAAWISPREALDRQAAGELSLVFPTIKHLESLAPYATSQEALAAVADLPPTPVLPRVVGEGEEQRVVLPGEPGYE